MHVILPQEVIRRKRDGLHLLETEIEAFVEGLTCGAISDAQASALAMAIFFRGMNVEECATLTRAMARSGAVLDWRSQNLPGPLIDKHSTGGVGDVVSLILAPMAAACGLYVPMIAGRGLGHTGGTIDKLESIPGYMVQPGRDRFVEVVRQCGCAIIGQTDDLAPADRKLYAIRDVTGTVESIPLVTASILSKKLAAGLDALIMDVKMGSGAFLPSHDEARALAQTIVDVGARAGLPVRALITQMDQPLAASAGNALEVAIAIDALTGRRFSPRLREVVLQLGVEMILAAKAMEPAEACRLLETALTSGAAAERFAKMAAALGGPTDLLERPEKHLPRARAIAPVHPSRRGYVARIDARSLGLCVVGLGGGRTKADARVNHSVGLSNIAEIGAEVSADAPLCLVHAESESAAAAAAEAIAAAYEITDERPLSPRPCIAGRV